MFGLFYFWAMNKKTAAILIALSLSTWTVTAFAQEPPTVPSVLVDLPSGNQAVFYLSMTAGEAVIAIGLMTLAAVQVFGVLQAWARGIRAR